MKTIKFTSLALLVTSFLLIFSSLGQAATIVIESQETRNAPGGASGSSNFGNYNSSGGSKLVVLVGGGRDRGSPLSINGVTFGGVSLTEAVKASSTVTNPVGTAAGVYYLDMPAGSGDLVVNWSALSWGVRNAITVLELSGTLPGHAMVASSPNSPSVDLGLVPADSLVVAASKAVVDGNTEIAQSPLVNANNTRFGAGYQFVDLEGNVTPTFADFPLTGAQVSGAGTTVAAVFLAVPEPSKSLLLGIGLLLGLARRRR